MLELLQDHFFGWQKDFDDNFVKRFMDKKTEENVLKQDFLQV